MNYLDQTFTRDEICEAFWKHWGNLPGGSYVLEALLNNLPERQEPKS